MKKDRMTKIRSVPSTYRRLFNKLITSLTNLFTAEFAVLSPLVCSWYLEDYPNYPTAKSGNISNILNMW